MNIYWLERIGPTDYDEYSDTIVLATTETEASSQ